MPVFYQLTIGEQAENFTSFQQLGNTIAKARSIFNPRKAEIGTVEQSILDHYIEIQDVKLRLKIVAVVCPQTDLFLNAMHNNVLEENPEAENVSFCEDKSGTFNQMEEIEAEKWVPQAQPSPHQPPSQ
uniref:Uncharacterized protein n=1 Tax=Romanomermis culicivorax TaxID=13658 RepID=A0A915I1Z7_ROMCU